VRWRTFPRGPGGLDGVRMEFNEERLISDALGSSSQSPSSEQRGSQRGPRRWHQLGAGAAGIPLGRALTKRMVGAAGRSCRAPGLPRLHASASSTAGQRDLQFVHPCARARDVREAVHSGGPRQDLQPNLGEVDPRW